MRHSPAIDKVRAALDGPLPGLQAQITMAPRPRSLHSNAGAAPRQAGVLLLLYPVEDVLHLVLTLRASALLHHSGQVSLPGGGWEEGDGSLQDTALREAWEEVGSNCDRWEMLGPLTPLYIPPSNNCVHPFVAHAPERPAFEPDHTEVAELLEVPLDRLVDPAARREEEWVRQGQPVQVPFYLLDGHKVWGATAMILAEFAALLRRVAGRPAYV
jgi:8-oxo-dGTP pyrophosphatase MutT (NUDIX family)